jgi:hypothetical protein
MSLTQRAARVGHDGRLVKDMKTTLHFDSHGLKIEAEKQMSEILPWSSVLEIFGFKEDVFAYDIICIGFRTDDAGLHWKVDEECDRYDELLKFLPEVFPGIRVDWFSDVAFPVFKPCVTTLWGDAKIKAIWETEPCH